MTNVFAHTPAPGSQEWHLLSSHLNAVAQLASEFAAAFDSADLAYWLGLWHDIGKFNPQFQEYLQRCVRDPTHKHRGPDHKAAGASIAQKHAPLLAMLIQGHHGGLRSPINFKQWFVERQDDVISQSGEKAIQTAIADAQRLLPSLTPDKRPRFPAYAQNNSLQAELFLRMLFSTLVDADVLDTEAHWAAKNAQLRGSRVTISTLWEHFRHDQLRYSSPPKNDVGRMRTSVYEACLSAAELPPGLFRLAVPTGGGKTRSAMAFALRHAALHGKRRVIVAVPFKSITEQTADVYRSIFHTGATDEPVVLEHHSGADAQRSEDGDLVPSHLWTRLTAENWDAPIIVTTTVQLFESLFANQTSRCRKLHRLANSVIILDEVQSLPPHLLLPILDGLRQLCTFYGATVVLSTATQPAFNAISVFASLSAVDIFPDAAQWFSVVKRVQYDWFTETPRPWAEIAELMRGEEQALAIVNTKPDALELLEALNDPDMLHLSTLLCGAHRRDVIATVRQRLAQGLPCRLVSTQVIEAGVDLDFPLVARALAPLDSIIQAAGRCNREGSRAFGRVIVFEPEAGRLPMGAYRAAVDITRKLLGAGSLDPDNPDDVHEYFRQLFETLNLDSKGIQKLRTELDYPEVARNFRMIEDDTYDVIVTTYGDAATRDRIAADVEHLRRGLPGTRSVLRRLQPYLVSLRKDAAKRYQRQGWIEAVPQLDGLGIWNGQYDDLRGLVADDDRESLVF